MFTCPKCGFNRPAGKFCPECGKGEKAAPDPGGCCGVVVMILLFLLIFGSLSVVIR